MTQIVAGPAGDHIPERFKSPVPPTPRELHEGRPVVLDRPAEHDVEDLPGDVKKRLLIALDAVEDGTAALEPKHRDLMGVFTLRITQSWRAAFYFGREKFWHLFAVTDHDYDEIERRYASLRIEAATAKWYHGTDAVLRPGDYLIPGGGTGRRNHELSQPGRVYLTTDPGIADVFGEDFSGGRPHLIYEVEPEGAVEVPGTGHEWTADRAKVVRVLSIEEARRLGEEWEEAETLRLDRLGAKVAGAKRPPATLFHYTSEMHLPHILAAGHLRLTESNISFTGAGPGVVWLTDTPTGAGNGVYGAKSTVKITLSPPPETHWWPEWSREQGIEDFWYEALERASDGGEGAGDHWWVCTQPIDLQRHVTKIEVNGHDLPRSEWATFGKQAAMFGYDDDEMADLVKERGDRPVTVMHRQYDDAFLALVGGVPAGQLTYTIEQDERAFSDDDDEVAASKGDHNGYYARIDVLVVDKHWRRRGIGTALLKAFITWADGFYGIGSDPKERLGWDPGGFTRDGAALWRAVMHETVPVTQGGVSYGQRIAALAPDLRFEVHEGKRKTGRETPGITWVYGFEGERGVGLLGFHTTTQRGVHQIGEIYDVRVNTEDRRRGIATALLAKAREVEPRVHHSDNLSDDGKAWRLRAAALVLESGLNGDLPEGVTFKTGGPGELPEDYPYRSCTEGEHEVRAILDGKVIGQIIWLTKVNPNAGITPGHITRAGVLPAYHRRGVATEMLRRAREVDPTVHHSRHLTDDGAAWSRSVASKTKESMANRSGHPQVDSAIEAFLNEPLDGGGRIRDLLDPGLSHGACQEITEQFVDFCKRRGLKAYSTDTDLEELGYKVQPGSKGGEIGFDENDEMTYGHYPEHTVATIVLAETGYPYGREIIVDFTASQYGYSDHPKVLSEKTALPSWRDRGEHPEAEALIVPDTGRSRRNSYSVYLYGQPHARRDSLEAAKQVVEEIYGKQDWKRLSGDEKAHHDRVWGPTTMFNDAPYYLCVERLPRLGATASAGDDVIRRGLTWYIPDTPRGLELAKKCINHTITAEEIVRAVQPLGVWWGLESQYGGPEDYEAHAEGNFGTPLIEAFADMHEEVAHWKSLDPNTPDPQWRAGAASWREYVTDRQKENRWFGGDVAVVFTAKRPAHISGVPWDPAEHNPLEMGGLMGNSYLPDHQPLEVIEVRYNVGDGYRTLKANGIRTTAAAMVHCETCDVDYAIDGPDEAHDHSKTASGTAALNGTIIEEDTGSGKYNRTLAYVVPGAPGLSDSMLKPGWVAQITYADDPEGIWVFSRFTDPDYRQQGAMTALQDRLEEIAAGRTIHSSESDFSYMAHQFRHRYLRHNPASAWRVASKTANYDHSQAQRMYGWGYEKWDRVGPKTMPFPDKTIYRNNPNEKYVWDQEAVDEAVRNPRFDDFDPRELTATQGGIRPDAVKFYTVSDEYARTGVPYADRNQAGNQRPVVYCFPDGTKLILSGHHRAIAALLKGEPLNAIRVDHPLSREALQRHADALRRALPHPEGQAGDLREGGRAGDRGGRDRRAARGRMGGGREGAGGRDRLEADRSAEGVDLQGRTAAVAPPEFDPDVEGWRPTKGMFAPGMTTLDPRVFDLTTNRMRPEVVSTVISTLDAYWTPKYGEWRAWARVYLAGSGASYWWDSDADMDILIGVDLAALREMRPANREVADEDVLAALNGGLQRDLRPTTTHLLGFEVTWFCNPGAFDIRAIHPYAAYDITRDEWVEHPPVLPADWGPDSIPAETWRRCEQAAREAEEVLSLPEPDRTIAGTVLFDWIHEGRRAAYSAHGGGWLDPGNVIYQYLTQHPHALLRRLYLCKHPEAVTEAEGIEKAAAGVYTGRVTHINGREKPGPQWSARTWDEVLANVNDLVSVSGILHYHSLRFEVTKAGESGVVEILHGNAAYPERWRVDISEQKINRIGASKTANMAYLCKHPEAATEAEGIEKAAASLASGYTMDVTVEPKSDLWGLPVLHVKVKHGGRTVGGLSVHQRLHEGDEKPVAHPNVWVYEEHQRKGLATAMYAEVKRRWPTVPIVHSPHASDAAKALNRTLAARKTYFHASPHRFEPGTVLAPGGGAPNFKGGKSECVYMADSEQAAENWGTLFEGGDKHFYIYEVKPIGPVEGEAEINPLMGFAPLSEFRAEAAEVVRLVRPHKTANMAYYAREWRWQDWAKRNGHGHLLAKQDLYDLTKAAQGVLADYGITAPLDLSVGVPGLGYSEGGLIDGRAYVLINPAEQNLWNLLHEISHVICDHQGMDRFESNHGPGFRRVFSEVLEAQGGIDSINVDEEPPRKTASRSVPGLEIVEASEEHLLPGERGVRAYLNGVDAGYLTWDGDNSHGRKGVINMVLVFSQFRRRGIATALLAKAREIDPDVRHDTESNQKPDGREWAKRTAMPVGPMPEGLRWTRGPVRTYGVTPKEQYQIVVKTADGEQVGHIRWVTKDYKRPAMKAGEILFVFVHEEFQRRGIATEMLRRARALDPRVHHSGTLTEDGAAWSQVAASRHTAARLPVALIRSILDTKPWLDSKAEDVLAGKVPGMEMDPSLSPGMVGHSYLDGRLVFSPTWWKSHDEFSRFLLVTHEVGHSVPLNKVQAHPDFAEVFGEHVGGGRYALGNPWGAQENLSEAVADGYSEICLRGPMGFYEDPEYPAARALKIIADVARAEGMPVGLVRQASLTVTADEDQCPYDASDSLADTEVQGGYICEKGHRWHPDDPAARRFHEGPGEIQPLAARTGTFWRVHPEGRAFGDWDATSKPFYNHPDAEPQRGYSCFENPWHLYLYVWIQWSRLYDGTTVLRFPGERVGEGHDGEDLAVPTALPFKTTWGDLLEMLPQFPLPDSPAFAPWVAQRAEYRTWKDLARHWKYLDMEDPVHEHVIAKVLPRRTAKVTPNRWFHACSPRRKAEVEARGSFPADYSPRTANWGAGVYLINDDSPGAFGDAVVEVAPAWTNPYEYTAAPSASVADVVAVMPKEMQKEFDKGSGDFGARLRSLLIAHGHDGLVVKRRDGEIWGVVFEPEKAKVLPSGIPDNVGPMTAKEPEPKTAAPKTIDMSPKKPDVLDGNGIYEMDMTGISTTRCVALLADAGGFLGYFPVAWLTWDVSTHTVEGVYVNEDYRGKGIATHLLASAEKAAGVSLKNDSGEYTPEGLAWAKKRGIDAKLKKRVPKSDMARMQGRMAQALWGGERAKTKLEDVR